MENQTQTQTYTKVTPYTTSTGIEIGKFYERRQFPEFSVDAELLQSAYLEDLGYFKREKLKAIWHVVGVVVFILLLIISTKN